jgi:hypothetical protein
MNPEIGRAGFTAAMFIVVTAVILLFVVPRGSPEFSITVVSLIVGLVFTAVVAVLVRVSSR